MTKRKTETIEELRARLTGDKPASFSVSRQCGSCRSFVAWQDEDEDRVRKEKLHGQVLYCALHNFEMVFRWHVCEDWN